MLKIKWHLSSFATAVVCHVAMLRARATLCMRRSAMSYAGTVVDGDAVQSLAAKKLERSEFKYVGSEKGGEVGARNEAAFIDYQPHNAVKMQEKYAMPNDVNLVTVLPILFLVGVATWEGWGVFLWDLYCRRHYSTVRIERPESI